MIALGENLKLPEEEGSEAVGIRDAPSVPKRTLFQEIFGASAFTEPPPIPVPDQGVQSSAWKGKDVEKILDAPAYLMPPLDALFDPLIQTFLIERPPEKATAEGDEEDAEQVDDPMDVGVEDGPILVGNRLERTVGQDEMSGLVDLFRAHAIRSELPYRTLPASFD